MPKCQVYPLNAELDQNSFSCSLNWLHETRLFGTFSTNLTCSWYENLPKVNGKVFLGFSHAASRGRCIFAAQCVFQHQRTKKLNKQCLSWYVFIKSNVWMLILCPLQVAMLIFEVTNAGMPSIPPKCSSALLGQNSFSFTPNLFHDPRLFGIFSTNISSYWSENSPKLIRKAFLGFRCAAQSCRSIFAT